MAGTTFKKPALSIASVIAGLFSPKYAEQNQTKWVKELVENGDFTDDADSWETINGYTIVSTGSKGRVTDTGNSSYFGAYQDINTEIGKTYTVSVDISNISTQSSFRIQDASGAGAGNIYYQDVDNTP